MVNLYYSKFMIITANFSGVCLSKFFRFLRYLLTDVMVRLAVTGMSNVRERYRIPGG